MTQKGIYGYEWQCEIKQATPDAGGWRVQLACASEGYEYTESRRWLLAPNGRLRETLKGETTEYVQCKGSTAFPLEGRETPAQAVPPPPAQREETCTSIQFAARAPSATIQGVAPAETMLCYQMTTMAGQIASLKVTAGNNVIVSIIGVGDARDSFQFRTEKKTYRIMVGQLMRSVMSQSFSIAVSIK